MFSYCENNPVNRIDRNGEDWESIFRAGAAIAIVGLALLAIIPTGGGSLMLAGVGVSAATATTAATSLTAAGASAMGASVVYASSQSPNYSGKSKELKNGGRIDYEYYGNGNGNVHYQNGAFKEKIWDLVDGKEIFHELSKKLAKLMQNEKVNGIVNEAIKHVIELAGK